MVRIIVDYELQQKYDQSRKLKHQAIKLCNDIKQSIGFILFNAIIYHIGKPIKLKASFIKERYNKKAFQWRKNNQLSNSGKQLNLFEIQYATIPHTYFPERKIPKEISHFLLTILPD